MCQRKSQYFREKFDDELSFMNIEKSTVAPTETILFNIDVEVYVVERPTFIDLTHKFFELKQANKLPAPHDIPHLNEAEHNLKIESIVSESEELKDATIEIGKDLFGDELKID